MIVARSPDEVWPQGHGGEGRIVRRENQPLGFRFGLRIGGEIASIINLWGVASDLTGSNIVVRSMGNGKYTNVTSFPFNLKRFSSRRHQKQEKDWSHIITLTHSNTL